MNVTQLSYIHIEAIGNLKGGYFRNKSG